MSPGVLPSGGSGSSIWRVWFSSWYVISIDTGHIAQSPQSGPRWSPAFKMEPVLSVSSFRLAGCAGQAGHGDTDGEPQGDIGGVF